VLPVVCSPGGRAALKPIAATTSSADA